MLNEVAAIAQILGFSLQTFDFINKKKRGGHSELESYNSALQALVFIRNPARAWKDVHMKYSSMRPYLESIYSLLSDSNGAPKPVGDIAPDILRRTMQNGIMYTALYNLETDLDASIKTLKMIQRKRKAEESDYEKLAAMGGKCSELCMVLRTLNSSLDNAIDKHTSICTFMRQVKEYNNRSSWDVSIVDALCGNRYLCKTAADNMLTYSDGTVMALLDIYITLVDEIEAKML